jgi:hypothetical protein
LAKSSHHFGGPALLDPIAQWEDSKTGEKQSRAGMQSYRIEDGKLVGTWITMRSLGTSWTDAAQERWTSEKK